MIHNEAKTTAWFWFTADILLFQNTLLMLLALPAGSWAGFASFFAPLQCASCRCAMRLSVLSGPSPRSFLWSLVACSSLGQWQSPSRKSSLLPRGGAENAALTPPVLTNLSAPVSQLHFRPHVTSFSLLIWAPLPHTPGEITGESSGSWDGMGFPRQPDTCQGSMFETKSDDFIYMRYGYTDAPPTSVTDTPKYLP